MRQFFTVLVLLLNQLCAYSAGPEIILTTGHTDQVTCLATSHDGKYLASGSLDKNVKIWDIATTKEFASLTGNDRTVSFLKFHPTKYLIGALFNSEQFKLFDVNGNIVFTLLEKTFSDQFYFSKNGAEILLFESNQFARWYNVSNGEMIRELEISLLHKLTYDPDKEIIYGVGLDGKMYHLNAQTGELIKAVTLFDTNIYPVTRLAFDKNHRYIAMAHPTDNQIYVYDVLESRQAYVLTGNTIRVRDMIFSKNGDVLFSVDFNGDLKSWDIKTGKLIKSGKAGSFSPAWLETSPREDVIMVADYKEVCYVDATTFSILKVFKSKAHRIVNFSYSPKMEIIATAADDITLKLWDLKQNKIVASLPGFFPCEFSPVENVLVTMHYSLKLAVYNPLTGEVTKYLDPEGELITNLTISIDGDFVAGAGWGGVIRVWNLESGKLVSKLKGHENGIYNLSFSPDGTTLASAGLDQTIRIWNVKKEKLLHTIKNHEVLASDVKFSPDGNWLASVGWDKKIFLYKTTDWTLNKTLQGHKNVILDVDFSPDSKYIATSAGNGAVGESDNSIMVWDVNDGRLICQLNNPSGQINRSIFDQRPGYLYSCSNDGMVKYWDYLRCEEVAAFMAFNATDYMITTPQMNYMCSKNALQGVGFKWNNELYSFDQFDLQYNRPDIVMKATAKSSENLINAYTYLYKKRLKKNDCQDDFSTSYDVPTVEIEKTTINYFTNTPTTSIKIKAYDKEFPLKKIIISVNGVPISEKTIEQDKTKLLSVQLSEEIHLLSGKNVIDVTAINSNGAESFADRVEITRQAKTTEETGKLYVYTIGISEYADSKFNLTYASKDALDLATKFKQANLGFTENITQSFTNQQFGINDFAALRQKLEQANPQDMVVLFFAGHGILDKEFNYFFCPYNMDFNNPSKAGLSFDELEKALKKCKAYRKLLIMDSCHSGEIDKDEIASVQESSMDNEGDIKFRSAGMEIILQNEFGLANTQHLMETVFADTRNETGATAITSAGGAEFAIESAEWKNGLFSYCLLNALTNPATDTDKNGEVSVGELRTKTYADVKEKSKGKQQPTTRSENVLLDFRVW